MVNLMLNFSSLLNLHSTIAIGNNGKNVNLPVGFKRKNFAAAARLLSAGAPSSSSSSPVAPSPRSPSSSPSRPCGPCSASPSPPPPRKERQGGETNGGVVRRESSGGSKEGSGAAVTGPPADCHVVSGDVQGDPGERQVRRLRLRARRAHLSRRHRIQGPQEAHGPPSLCGLSA